MRRSGKFNKSKLLLKFRKLGLQLNLVFSNCELLGDILMGLDLKKRKLVIADKKGNINWRHTIELADLRTISVRKVYRSIRAGELSLRNVADFIHSIHVRLDFRNGEEAIVLPVYADREAENEHILKIERKLGRWHSMVSRSISS